MDGFRYNSILSQLSENMEKLVYNATIKRISKTNASPCVEDFRIVYNWLVQVVLEDKNFVREAINNCSIKPSDMIKKLLHRLDSNDDHHLSKISPEDDVRISTRYHVSRILCKNLGKTIGVSVEKSIAKHQKSKKQYKQQSLKLISNINNAKTNLKDRLLNGTFKGENMGNATHKLLWPELWKRPEMQPGILQ